MFADGEVTSQNIVGYTQKDIPASKFRLVMPQFVNVADGETMNIADLVGHAKVAVGTYNESIMAGVGAAEIQIPEGNGYKICYYVSNAWTDDGSGGDAYVTGWCDVDGLLICAENENLENGEFTPGVGIWFKNPDDAGSFDVSGAVSADSSADVDCPAGFKIRGNPFPMSVVVGSANMNSLDATPGTYDESIMAGVNAPEIQIPDGNGYKMCYFVSNAWTDDGAGGDAYVTGWCDVDGLLICAENENIENGTVPVSTSIWTRGQNQTFTLTFTK